MFRNKYSKYILLVMGLAFGIQLWFVLPRSVADENIKRPPIDQKETKSGYYFSPSGQKTSSYTVAGSIIGVTKVNYQGYTVYEFEDYTNRAFRYAFSRTNDLTLIKDSLIEAEIKVTGDNIGGYDVLEIERINFK